MQTSSTQLYSLDQFILEKDKGFSEDFFLLLRNIALAAKLIHREVNRAGLSQILGEAGYENVQGEEVKKLDEFSNDVLIKMLQAGKQVCAIASEELDDYLPATNQGNFTVLFDPLDGSSNIDCNISIGTIFSIYKRKTTKGESSNINDLLQAGNEQIAAGYVVYGSSTILVYTTGHGVNGFTLEPAIGEFFLSHPDMQMPKKSSIYSLNEGISIDFDDSVKNWLDYIKQTDKLSNRPYKARYVGSLVADFHRTLIKGGIFVYPSTQKTPKGKLRLLYEGNPLAFIAEQAGGKATDGNMRILDIQPDTLHQRTPLYIGSADEVELAMNFLNKSVTSI